MRSLFPLIIFALALALAPSVGVVAQDSGKALPAKDAAPVLGDALRKRVTTLRAQMVAHHLDVGQRYLKQELYLDARLHLLRVLFLDPENVAAHEGLGHKLVDGKWDRSTEIPRLNVAPAEDSKLTPEPIDLDDAAFAKSVAKQAESLASDLEKDKLHVKAQEWWHQVMHYAPNNARAAKALGWIEVDGIWMRRESASVVKKARLLLKDGSEGTRDRSEDKQAEACNLTFVRRKSAHFIARTSMDMERAQRMLKVGNGVANFTQELLGDFKGTPTRTSPYTLTLVKERADFSNLYSKYHEDNLENRAIAKEASGIYTKDPIGFMVLQHAGEIAADDSIGNSVAISVLNNYRSSASAPWLLTGFGYYVTANVLDSASTRRFAYLRDGHTRVKGARKTSIRGNPFAPEDLRLVAREMVQIGDDQPFAKLALKTFDQISEYDAAKAFAIVEYCFEVHEAKTLAWLKRNYQNPEGDLATMLKEFAMSGDAFEEAWRAWVLKNY